MKKKILMLLVLSTAISYSKKWSDLVPRTPHPPCENKTIVKMWYENNKLKSNKNHRLKLVKLEDGSIWETFDTSHADKFKKGVKMNKNCPLLFSYLDTEKTTQKKGK